VTSESELREKLRKIEALFAGAKTDGERLAAGAAAERIKARLGEMGAREAAIEMRFALHDPWSRKLFVALARRYGLRPYRLPRMKRQSVVLRAPQTFIETVFWPEFQELNSALSHYLDQVTDRLIREEVHADTTEARETSGD